ncbi:MAG: hypothetical protein AB8B80_01490 [Marinicellaceae bacterium]
MQTNQLLLKLRIQWFKLKAMEFLIRYQNGLFVLIIFLPGIAVGDNLLLILKALSTPFLQVGNPESLFLQKLIWLFLLHLIFITFSQSQSLGIKGGGMAIYLRSLPISGIVYHKINLILILFANHFLWIIIVSSFYFQVVTDDNNKFLILFNNLILVCTLITSQYIVLFNFKLKLLLCNILISILLFVKTIDSNKYFLNLVILALWIYLIFQIVKPDKNIKSFNWTKKIKSMPLMSNWHCLMLFRAKLVSTCFRLLLLFLLIIGFTLVASHFIRINSGQLLPYALVIEGLLAYYLSGFFVFYVDQRNQLQFLFRTLPFTKFYWFYRDYLSVLLLSLSLHCLLYFLIQPLLSYLELLYLVAYHLLLLLVCYPIRVFAKTHQTILTFMVLTIVTVFTLYNYS